MPTLSLVLALAALPGPVFLPGTQAHSATPLALLIETPLRKEPAYVPKQEAGVKGWEPAVEHTLLQNSSTRRFNSSCPMLLAKSYFICRLLIFKSQCGPLGCCHTSSSLVRSVDHELELVPGYPRGRGSQGSLAKTARHLFIAVLTAS